LPNFCNAKKLLQRVLQIWTIETWVWGLGFGSSQFPLLSQLPRFKSVHKRLKSNRLASLVCITLTVSFVCTTILIFNCFLFVLVVGHLLRNGDKQDEVNSNVIRQRAILLLCQMNPSQTILIRTNCIETCRLPSLAIYLALEDKSGTS
jgi:hypothetical protein